MNIQRKKYPKWQFQQSEQQKYVTKNKNTIKNEEKGESYDGILYLPKYMLEQQKISSRKMLQAKNGNFKNDTQVGFAETIENYHNGLRTTLLNRTKQIFRPLKRHTSVLEGHKPIIADLQIANVRTNKNIPVKSSQKTLNMLQRIILREVDFYAKQKAVIQLKATKLPIIEYKSLKRKQSLEAYSARFISPNASIKYEAIPIKQSQRQDKKAKEKPYFSGWEFNQVADF